jgi:hypothetical protein
MLTILINISETYSCQHVNNVYEYRLYSNAEDNCIKVKHCFLVLRQHTRYRRKGGLLREMATKNKKVKPADSVHLR